MGNNVSEMESQAKDQIRFTVNGKLHIVGPEVGVETRLVRFLRNTLHLTGTKFSCGQGGCGACTVTVKARDPGTGMMKTRAMNSCLVPVLSCDGWEITTVESLGNRKEGFHPLQSRLAKFNGSQCGFCSPGFIMATNSLLNENESPNMKDIEHNLDGNICRCTGFRPILDAMKSFAGDDHCGDIEDLAGWVCPKMETLCCTENQPTDVLLKDKRKSWISPAKLSTLFDALKKIPETSTYKLVAGNTGVGVYEDKQEIDHFIDISKIPELKSTSLSPLQVGGGVSLADAMKKFEALEESAPSEFWYLKEFCKQLKYVASTAVRETGSIGGNLMLKHGNPEFQSDVFNLLEVVGAKITIDDGNTQEEYLPSDWMQIKMDKKIILKITFPEVSNTHVFSYYKVTPRAAFAHAHVNAAFMADIAKKSDIKIVKKPSFVYGGVSGEFIHASKAEEFIVGKDLKNPKNVKQLLEILAEEATPDDDITNAGKEYRSGLVLSLMYKFLLRVLGDSVPEEKKTGMDDLRFLRPLQKGSQEYKTDPKLYPINKPVEKLEATLQCSGEAEYVNDIPALHNEVHAAMVLSTQANCDIDSVDTSEAMKVPGVIGYVDHDDIPGINNVTAHKKFAEPVFVKTHISYAGQAIGLIVADSFEVAHKASRMVKIAYKNKRIPILSIKEALKYEERVSSAPVGDPIIEGDIKNEHANAEKTITGEFNSGSQYHFHLETQTCICRPIEDGLDVFCATQNVDLVQRTIASNLNMKESDINMTVRRLGGAYGGKISNPNIPAVACAVAATKLNRPVRLSMDLRSNMEMLGKRLPYLTKYKASVDTDGKISAIGMKIFCDSGYNYNESTADGAAYYAKNVYNSKAWKIKPKAVLTDKASNTYVRAPGSTQGHAAIENVMEHLAHEVGEDPLEFRLKNMVGEQMTAGKVHPIRVIIERLKKSSDYENRKKGVELFNKKNLWQKKGIALIPTKYNHNYFGTRYHVNISVYHDDGSVAVSHGAIEMGQGVNTKVCQVVAKELGIPMELIRIKPTNNFNNANGSVTGGSMGSECNCSAAQIACQKLKDKMKEVRNSMNNPDWKDLVKKCYMQGVDLSAHHMGHSTNDNLKGYNIWNAVVTEVQIDVLTGMMTINRCDILEDTGMAISPEVDIGQVEGGLIMGLGLWTSEKLRYNPVTGQLVDNSTWHYKVPMCFDVPADLRTEFYDSGNNPNGVLGSKATGEPSVLSGCSVLFALRMAVASARKDAGFTEWFQFDGPATVESIKTACQIDKERLTL